MQMKDHSESFFRNQLSSKNMIPWILNISKMKYIVLKQPLLN